MFVIPTADSLVTYLKDFTGSDNDTEIKQCIFQAELAMRNIELPALRTDPYTTFGTVGPGQLMPIPTDMNKPILFFQQGSGGYTTTATATGTAGSPIINLTSVPGQGLQIGMSVTGTGIATGAIISSFNTSTQAVLSLNNTGTVNGLLTFATTQSMNATNSGPWIVYDRIGDRDIITQGLIAQMYLSPVNVPMVIRGKFSEVGQYYQFLPFVAEGAQINLYYYKAWDLLFTPVTGGEPGETLQTNAVLQTWPEGYIYGSLVEYYIKRHSPEDAAVYKAKFDEAWKTVEYQNSLGKWSGGHTKITSIFQPRRDRSYAIK